VAGRPRIRTATRPGGNVEEQILDAAAGLFSAQGYAGTTTRAIAEAAGLRQPSLYYYFASKEELFARLVGFLWRPALAYGMRLTEAEAPPDARMYALVSYDVEVLRALPWRIGTLYYAPELRAPEFAAVAAERRRLHDLYRAVTREGAEAGRFQIDDPRFTSDLLFGLTEGIVNMTGDVTERTPVQWGVDVADHAMRLLAATDPAAAGAAGLALRARIPGDYRSSR